MLTPSLPNEDPDGLSVAAWRRIQAGHVVNSAAGVPRTGVITGPALLVTGTTDQAMTYRIGQFVGASSRDGVGVEFVANDASDTVGTDIAPQANSRIDVIWFRSRFPSLTDAGQTKPLFGVTRGVANANPQKPAIPAGAEELATAVVTSTDLVTQTSVITQTAKLTVMAGGRVPLRNQAEMDAWVPADGSTAYRIDTGRFYSRAGGQWVLTGAGGEASGVINPGLSAGGDGFQVITHGLPSRPRYVHVSVGPVNGETDALGRIFTPRLWDFPSPTTFRVRWRRDDTLQYIADAQAVRLQWNADL